MERTRFFTRCFPVLMGWFLLTILLSIPLQTAGFVCNQAKLNECYAKADQDTTSCQAGCPVGAEGANCRRQCLAEEKQERQYCEKAFGTCAAGSRCCNGQCAEVTSDPQNCGKCDTVCPNGSCSGGVCGCPGGKTACGTRCFDLRSDPSNCGSCGHSCRANERCVSGNCKPPICTANTLDECYQQATLRGAACKADCPRGGAGAACLHECLNEEKQDRQDCKKQYRCPKGKLCCGGDCVPQDIQNCEACGKACAKPANGAPICSNGACGVLCNSGFTACGNACVDLNKDLQNCGVCGRKCTVMRANCSNGMCACPPREVVCSVGPVDLCVNLNSDTMSCGRCGYVCPRGASCSNGKCVCPTGQSSCDGACTNTQNDSAHCGSCGHECPQGASCQRGGCLCPPGATMCGNACINTNNDSSNCGSCGHICGSGQYCSNGTCLGHPTNVCPDGHRCSTSQSCCGSGCVTSGVDSCCYQGSSAAYACGKDTYCCNNPSHPKTNDYCCCNVYDGHLVSCPGPGQ